MAKKTSFGTFIFYVILAIGASIFTTLFVLEEFGGFGDYEFPRHPDFSDVIIPFSLGFIIYLIVGRIVALITIVLNNLNHKLSGSESEGLFDCEF